MEGMRPFCFKRDEGEVVGEPDLFGAIDEVREAAGFTTGPKPLYAADIDRIAAWADDNLIPLRPDLSGHEIPQAAYLKLGEVLRR